MLSCPTVYVRNRDSPFFTDNRSSGLLARLLDLRFRPGLTAERIAFNARSMYAPLPTGCTVSLRVAALSIVTYHCSGSDKAVSLWILVDDSWSPALTDSVPLAAFAGYMTLVLTAIFLRLSPMCQSISLSWPSICQISLPNSAPDVIVSPSRRLYCARLFPPSVSDRQCVGPGQVLPCIFAAASIPRCALR